MVRRIRRKPIRNHARSLSVVHPVFQNRKLHLFCSRLHFPSLLPPPPPQGKYSLRIPEKWSIMDPMSSCKIEVPAICVVLGYLYGAKSHKTLMMMVHSLGIWLRWRKVRWGGQILMVLRTEFHGVQPAKNPHRDAYRDVTGGGKKKN